jgi:tetratricopeptide (TPR) repeat protein
MTSAATRVIPLQAAVSGAAVRESRAIKSLLSLSLLFLCALSARAGAREVSGPPENVQKLYNSAHYREASQAIKAALETNPEDSNLLYWLGRCFYELHDFARSVTNLEHAITIDPNRSEFHDWLGKAWGRRAEEAGPLGTFSALGMARKASREFDLAVRLQPENLEAHRDLIRYLMNAPGIAGGSEDRALDQIIDLEKVDPAEGALARAELFATHKRFDEANDQYQKVLRMPVRRAGVGLEVAEYYRDRGDAEHMEQAVNAAAAVDPSDRRLLYYRGVMLVLAHRNPDEAEKHLRTYLDTVPGSAEVPPHSSAHEWLGKLYEYENHPDRAIEEYQAALALDPHNKGAREALKQLQKK